MSVLMYNIGVLNNAFVILFYVFKEMNEFRLIAVTT